MELSQAVTELKNEFATANQALAEGKADKSEIKSLADKITQVYEMTQAKREEENAPKSRIFQNSKKAERFYDFLASTSASNQFRGSKLIQNAVAATSDAAGGYLAPEEFSPDFLQLIPQYSASFGYHNVRTLGAGNVYEQTKKTATGTAHWQLAAADGGALTESSPTFGVTRISPELLYALTDVTIRMALQSRFAVAEMVAEDISISLGVAIDAAVAKGDGTSTYGNITGYMTDTTIAANEVTVTSWANLVANASSYGFNKLIDTMNGTDESVLRNNLPGTGWYGHVHTINSLRKIKDSQGNPLWEQSTQAGTPSKLLGYPVYVYNGLLKTDPYGISTGPLLFGNPRQAGVIVQNSNGVSFASSDQSKFGNAVVEFRGLWLGSFGIVQPRAVALLTE